MRHTLTMSVRFPLHRIAFLLAVFALAAPLARAQAVGGNTGRPTTGGNVNLGNVTGNLPAGVTPGNIATIIGNLPPGTNLGNLAGAIGGNGTVSTTPTIITANGLLAGDSGTANAIIPSQTAAAIAGGATDPNAIVTANSNTYLWSITGGTITSDPTLPTVTYTASAAGTVTLSVAVTVVGSSAVSASTQVTVISPETAGTITAPSSVATNATTATATVPAAVNNDRTFRWTVSGDAAITGGATTNSVRFRPGTPGLKDLTCAVRLQNLVTVNIHSFVVVTGDGPNATVTVTNGSGGGTYPGGSRVDLFADPPAAGQVFDHWTGDTAVLGTGALAASLPHAVITVPATAVALTATYKTVPTWSPATVTAFNPQTFMNATGTATTVTTALAYYIPAGAAGVVFLLHDTGGSIAEWFSSPEQALLVRDLVAAGFGVAALNNVNRNTGAWSAQAKLADNPDALNVAAALDKFARDGVLAATKPVFLLGLANGANAAANFGELLATATPARPVKGVVLYLAAGSETLAVTSHVPQFFALASNDDNLGTAGLTTARNNSQLLVGRGITSASATNAIAPVYANRFRALGVTASAFTSADATAIFDALKKAGLLDANSYLKEIPTDAALKAALPAAYQNRVADVAAELSAAFAGPTFFSDLDSRVIAFLNTRVAGAPGPTPGRLANLSTLGKIYSVGDSFALGFNLAGPAKATLLIRGIGPALAKFGVSTALPAPRLEIYQGSTLLTSNQGWDQGGATSTAQLTAAMTAVGAFPLAAGDADSAVVLSLSPGSYTVSVKGVNGAIGDVLAEVYDVTKNSTRLTNLSTLASINNDGDMLVPGIVIQGANPRTLLVRAVGPGLADLGIPSAALLGDPRVTVLNGTTTVATNNNWSQGGASSQAAALTAAFPAVGAFTLKAGTADSALVTALSAGNFTLQADAAPVANNSLPGQQAATAAANQTGTVLVEVYEVP